MTEIRKKGDPVLGAELRAIREAAKLTQQQLAELLGMKSPQISRIEKGTRNTGVSTIRRWYQACGYELESVKVGTADQAQTLAMAAAALPEDDLDTVIDIINAWPSLTERQRGRILGIIEADEA